MSRNKYPEETVRSILETAERLFTEKGYEKTSLQDIINATKLSKGAIYHHFVSKDDIFIKICENKGRRNEALLSEIRDDKTLNGRDKLKAIFTASVGSRNNREVVTMQPYLTANPKFLAAQIKDIFDEIAPHYLQPILEQGIADGTIHTDHPKETAEMIMLLANIWISPMLLPTGNDELKGRCEVFVSFMKSIGVDLSEDLVDAYVAFNDLMTAQK